MKYVNAVILLLFVSNLFAKPVEVNGIYYELLDANRAAITIPKNNAYNAYSGDLYIPNTILFHDTIYQVTDLWDSFRLCKNLKTIHLPDSISYILTLTFVGCSSLKKIELPNGVKSIGHRAFSDCKKLREIVLSEKLLTIDEYAFEKCKNLRQIVIPENVQTISDGVFIECRSLQSVKIPNSVVSVGEDIFLGCNKLQFPIYNCSIFLKLPRKYIGEYIIPNGIKYIANNAFEGCRKLTRIIIPNSVDSIEMNAFYGCPVLKEIYVYRPLPPKIVIHSYTKFYYEEIINNAKITSKIVFHIPKGTKEVYSRAEYWCHFVNFIDDL